MRGVVRARVLSLLLGLTVLAGCVGEPQGNKEEDTTEPAPVQDGPELWEVPSDYPVQIQALPNGDVLVASMDGRVFLYGANGTMLATVIEIEVQGFTGEYGLLGLAVHPDYPESPWIYVFYTLPAPVDSPQGGAIEQRIARFELPENSTQAGSLEPLVELPASPGCCHNGGRLAFGDDGLLYASLGDLMQGPRAQVPTDVAGSILRYTQDGGIPDDNPYPDSPVAVTGIRNAFGLYVDPELGIIVTDNGPSTFDGPPGYDQVYVFQIGDNGGWPIAYGDDSFPGRTDPVWHSGPSATAPTGVHVPRDSQMPEWDDKILFCNWNTDEALLLDPAGDPEPEVVYDDCRFDVTQDPLGRILIAGPGTISVFSTPST